MRKYFVITIVLLVALGLMQSVSLAVKGAGYYQAGHHGSRIGKMKMQYVGLFSQASHPAKQAVVQGG